MRTCHCSPASRAVLICVLLCFTQAAPTRADDQSLHDLIDAQLQAAWEREKISPVEVADDATFLRRVYLDLVGDIPTLDEAKSFLNDATSDKRERLIDQLLDDPRYAQHQADLWDMILFGRNPPSSYARTRGGFQKWLKQQFADNVPYDQMVRTILRGEGDTVEHGPPMYLVQYARQPEDAAVAVTQTFLGTQLQCARCHDHPFDRWTQIDFYGMAAFFARLQVVTVGKEGRDTKLAVGEKNLGEVLFSGTASDQTPGKEGKPVGAKFLNGNVVEEPELPEDFEEPRNFPANKVPPAPKFSRKDLLADWVTQPDNPYFARSIANRIWAQFMGQGIVHPVDNMSDSNPPSHPELFDALTAGLISHQFDLKWLMREICLSKAYQLADAGEIESAMPIWFQRARVRPLSAEELAEAWRTATSYDEMLTAAGKEIPEDRFHGVTRGYMMSFFGRPNDGVGNFQGGLHEHLYLNNGQVGQLITTAKGGLYDGLVNLESPWEERVELLFLATLSRPPSDVERARFAEYISAEKEPRYRLTEAIWTLLTCSEFRFNH